MPDEQGRVRYGVVGAGWISQGAFMPGVGQTANSVMTALVTGDPEKRAALGRMYGLKGYRYEDYDALLASGAVDAVYVATPNVRHREFAEPALKAGIHVLLEKPMECSVSDCEALRSAAAASGARLMIGYRLHCEPGTIALVQALREGAIGTPHFFSSNFSQHVDPSNHRAHGGYWGGPVPDMGAYPINAARNLFEAEPVEVTAAGVRTDPDLDFHDVVSVVLRFPQDRLASFTVSYASVDIDEIRIVGSKGVAKASPAFGFGKGTAIGFTIVDSEGKETRHDQPVVDHFAGQTDYFSACILEDRDPEPDGEEGLLDVIVLEAIERALETGRPQAIEPRERRRRIQPEQERRFPLADVPDFVNAAPPTG